MIRRFTNILQRRRVLLTSSFTGTAAFSVFTTQPTDSYLSKSCNDIDQTRNTTKNNNITKCKILNDHEIRKIFTMKEAIPIQAKAFVSMYRNETIVPGRIILSMPNTTNDDTLFKPCVNNEICGQKIAHVRPKLNPSISGCILLFDIETGNTLSLMDCSFITAVRTAAGSGLATDLFAKSDINQLTVFGAGAQAEQHIYAVLTVRNTPKDIYIINRTLKNAEILKKKVLKTLNVQSGDDVNIIALSLEDFNQNQHGKYKNVISEADVICTCTNSDKPLFDGSLLSDGCHINSVGAYKANMVELDEQTFEKCYLFVDSIHAFDCGDLYNHYHGNQDEIEKDNQIKWREIGEYINNDEKGKEIGNNNIKNIGCPIDAKFEKQITVFNSVGVAAQDLLSAQFVYNQAKSSHIGSDVVL